MSFGKPTSISTQLPNELIQYNISGIYISITEFTVQYQQQQ